MEEFRFRKTRKVYIGFYITSFLLIISYFYFRVRGFDIKSPILIIGCIFIIIGLKYTEVDRLHNLYGYNSRYIFHKRGFLRRRIKKVFLARISDIILTRGVINRIFNYGDVKIHHFGGSGVIEIKKINSPHKFIEGLQDMIHKSHPQQQ
ncbi:MAG: PH domain-containing protein [Candidatus Peregrinibacteria bacterium]|nr:PH domain-containing protein [Candidatus Peregrinibacteria bacterium]